MPYAYAVPIPSGKSAEVRRFIGELLGAREAECKDLARRADVIEESYWLQAGPDGDMFVVSSSSDQRKFDEIGGSPETEFDRWIRQKIQSVFGFDPGTPPGPRNELLGEWSL